MKVYEVMKPENWTQGTTARNKEGEKVNCDDPAACKFCVMGHMIKVYGREYLFQEKFNKFIGYVGTQIGPFNDMHSFDRVLQVCKELDI